MTAHQRAEYKKLVENNAELTAKVEGLEAIIIRKDEEYRNLKAEDNAKDAYIEALNKKIGELTTQVNSSTAESYASIIGNEVKSCANKLEYNTVNLKLLVKYTHAKYLETLNASQPGIWCNFIASIHESIKPSASFSASNVVFRDKSVATVLACLLQYANICYSWNYAIIQSLSVRSLSNSPQIQDFLSYVTPGGCSGRTLVTRGADFVTLLKREYSLDPNSYVIMGYNNCPETTSKSYQVDHSRSSVAHSGSALIGTTRNALHILSATGSINLQKDAQYSPRFDAPLRNNDGTLHPDVPTDLHQNSSREREFFRNEVKTFLKKRLVFFIRKLNTSKKRSRESSSSSSSSGARTSRENLEDSLWDNGTGVFQHCELCRKNWAGNSKQKCTIKEGGCGRDETLIQFIEWKRQVPGPKLMESRESSQRQFLDTSISRSLSYDEETESLETPIVNSSSVFQMPPEMRERRGDTREDEITSSGNDKITHEILLPLALSPTGEHNIKYILQQCLTLAGVAPTGALPGDRAFVDISADLGAIMWRLIDDNRHDSEFGNIRFRFPLGHEFMSLLKVFLKILNEHGYNIFAPSYGFKSPKSIDCLFSRFDVHICWDFCEWLYPILVDKAIEAWYLSNSTVFGDIANEHELINTLDNFVDLMYTWIFDFDGDVTFETHSTLVFVLFPALKLVVSGTRLNNQFAYNIGRKEMLSILPYFHHSQYYIGIFRDIYEYFYRCKPEVRDHYIRNFSFGTQVDNKQGVDFITEQDVANMQQVGISNSFESFEFAAVLADSVRGIRECMYIQAGLQVPRDYNVARSLTSYAASTEAASVVIDTIICFDKISDRDRSIALTLNGNDQFLNGTDLGSLRRRGVDDALAYIASGFKSNVVPKGIEMRTTKKVDGEGEFQALNMEVVVNIDESKM